MTFTRIGAKRRSRPALAEILAGRDRLPRHVAPISRDNAIDLGPARSWGERFPKRASAFAAETPPAPEALEESRTLKGGGAAGVATIGTAGVEMAQEALAETQSAILPLTPTSTPSAGCSP